MQIQKSEKFEVHLKMSKVTQSNISREKPKQVVIVPEDSLDEILISKNMYEGHLLDKKLGK